MGQNSTNARSPQPNAHEEFLLGHLKDLGYLTGKDIHDKLISHFDVSSETARKITQRAVAKGLMRSSKPYTFGNKQYVYYKFGNVLGKEEVKSITKTERPPVYRLITAIEENKGIISYYEALKITASPVSNSSSKISTLEDILSLLTGLKLAYVLTDTNGVKYIIERNADPSLPTDNEESLMRAHYSKMVVDCTFLPDIVRWLQQANLVGENAPVYRNRSTPSLGARHNNFMWDAFAYTRTTGINELVGVKKAAKQDAQTFVPLDVVLSREYSEVELDGFVSRVQVVIQSVKLGRRKVLPIIIYRAISPVTKRKIRSLGFLSIDIASIFGKHVHTLLEHIRQMQLSKREGFGGNGQTVDEMLALIEKMGQGTGLRTLRGILFEYLMYPLVKTIYPNAKIQQGVKIPKTVINLVDDADDVNNANKAKEYFEYDFIVESSNPSELVIIEAKGYAKGHQFSLGPWDKKGTVKWFFGNSFKSAKTHYEGIFGGATKITGCFITSSGFTKEASEWLDKPSNSGLKPKHLELSYDRQKLFELLEEYDFSHIRQIVDQYYITEED